MTIQAHTTTSYINDAKEAKRRATEERQYRDKLMASAKEDGIGIVHIYDTESPKGGLTIAFSKSNEYKSGYMVDVAVNTCSHEDSFSKKIGTLGALEKFYAGQVISLPLLKHRAKEDINFAVKRAFIALYFFN